MLIYFTPVTNFSVFNGPKLQDYLLMHKILLLLIHNLSKCTFKRVGALKTLTVTEKYRCANRPIIHLYWSR